MKEFYKDRYDFYLNLYWDKPHDSILKPNGFSQYPYHTYNRFADVINCINNKTDCIVMDICCGNGLLLKYLIEHCNSQIIPFGIDFLKLSIEQAVKVVHPNFSQNFFVSNAVTFDFSKYIFDFILLDPYHFADADLTYLLPTIIRQTRNKVIFYTYSDVLTQNKYSSVADFPALKNVTNLKVFNYNEVSIAISKFYVENCII